MATRPSRLGKGLDGLFAPSAPQPSQTTGQEGSDKQEHTPVARLIELPLGEIVPNPHQPRKEFEEDALAELAESVREFGVLQPIVVRETAEGYELIMGERRYRASQLAGRDTIPAIIRDTADNDMLRDALIENVHRADLNPIEEAMAYTQLLNDFGCSKEELAQRIHRSRPVISNTLRLLQLPTKVQSRIAAGVLSAGHARALLGLDDAAAQEELATRIVAEGLSVRSTEELVALAKYQQPSSPRLSRGARTPSDRERELAGHLSDHFDTRVKVNIGRNKGKITIEFATGEDLERIMAIIDGTTVSY